MEHINTRIGLSPDQFKNAFRRHPAGVAVITADDGSGPVALTATSVISVSAEPPLLVFSLSGLSSSTPVITASRSVVVHLLDASRVDLAVLASTKNVDRFAESVGWHRLPTGEPVYDGVPNWIRGEIVDSMGAGGSTIVAVLALESGLDGTDESKSPLVYHDRTWHHIGEHSVLAG
ncbi:flavin reductase family protein [Herbiconiux ginsengi]|uniref:NADH-FMN oxidoreductase RutF, flavin reductase (DIM6/NTAB) family n=1 Tax=Herbiconiux ginsengi TaxID=381665 RepID=A0A1H3LMF3_9MICO|nr:flavin reductase family protein [Herbiconiux ginsengi]SDY65727.1 NADH-FMN oxidoreductase RutF, flavin reductase (DIM6/NTAB) family [Herbiconiux ginsengi]